MGVTWTSEQQKVIDLRGCNILVSAAAGSGKTAVLVERIITMLTDEIHPVSVDELLVVTFTEAAAAEMKERIRLAIEKKLLERPDDEHLRQQATLIHNAQITTIHSFCLSVVKDHFHAIDLDPGFRIGEEGELKLLKHDVLDEILEENYAEGEQDFLDFVSAYGSGRDDKKIEDLIFRIYDYSRSYPDAEGWLDSCVEAYSARTSEEFEKTKFSRLVMENVKALLSDAAEMIEDGLIICGMEDGPHVYENALQNDREMLDSFLAAETFSELSDYMQNVKWTRLAANRDKTVSEEKTEQVKVLREQAKELVGSISSQYFYQNMEELLQDMRVCKPKVKVLTGLVNQFAERFELKKREKELIDFSDMEQYALRILTQKTEEGFVPSVIAEEYSRQFTEIMIDEYQDSNLIQETILTSISRIPQGEYNIFMVGDVKQSIYRFRLSRPELFMEKYNTYRLDEGEKQRIDLHKNFRSRWEVLESINFLFRQMMTESLGGIAYDEKAALYPGADYPECEEGFSAATEVLMIDTQENEKDLKSSETFSKISEKELEASAIAGRIRELLRCHKVTDKKTGKLRPVKYSDIVILIRSTKGFSDTFTEVLSREGIPVFAGTSEGYFATQEIGVLLDYLRVLNNPKQDIPLAAVLTSAFCSLTEQELALIKNQFKELPFSQAVFAYGEEGEEDHIRKKIKDCLEQMEKFRKIVAYTPMHELLRKIMEDTGYEDLVSAMPGGEQRRANLLMLLEKAKAFESTSYKGLFHFVRYVEQLKKYDVDYGEAAIEDEKADTVRIMTIHKSKGLEFPIVFVAGMGKRFNMQDARSSVVLHSSLGIGLDAIDMEKRTKSPCIIKKVIQKEEALETLGEELRVLYVALTRAKEKLIITGTFSNLEKKLENCRMVTWQNMDELSFSRLSRAVTYWDFLLPALMRLDGEVPIEQKLLHVEDLVREAVEEEVTQKVKAQLSEQWDTQKVYSEKVRRMVEEQFSYEYPYGKSQSKKLKFTVSELKKRAYLEESLGKNMSGDAAFDELGEVMYEEPEVMPLLPKFLQQEEELSGASRGTAYHRVMELLDFTEKYTEDKLEKELKQFCDTGRLSEEELSCICSEDILKFLGCTSGKRMHKCALEGKLKKEQPFVLGMDAREIYPDEEEGEMILIQGIIDIFFEEEDGLVVLDYKTDKVTKAEELVEKYHAQLDYYAKALEQMTGKKVKEKIIYSFTLEKEIILS
ncbi:MAG: helicase-exonuclease AddAB subunit AddA [Lachnospiraceae bacterium]